MATLAGQVDALKKQYAGQKLYDRIADVEVFLNAVKFTMEDKAGTPNPYANNAPFSGLNLTQGRAALATGGQRAASWPRDKPRG